MTPELAGVYLGALLEWAETAAIRLDRRTTENQWLSLPLPTRRFGPDAWAMFAMRNVAGRPTIGPFKAWILLDNDTPRVMAYLEPPFADTFGSVEPFPRQGAGLRRLPDDLLAALGRAGELFFGREAVNLETLDTVHEILDVIQPELGQRLQAVAPDFFSWALRDDHRFDASSTDC